MGDTAEQRERLDEARAIAASAAALLREFIEEDDGEYERLELPSPAAAAIGLGERRVDTARAPAHEKARRAPTRTPPLPASAVSADARDPTPWADRQPTLEEVRAHLGDCQRCGLCEGRSKIVFGDGNPNADLMFIGEGPGEHEDRQGLPFVGRAGELLTQMIEKGIGLSRSDVYICNIVKCRPPNNRTPLAPEVSACRPFLDGQIRAVAPKVIVTLGKPAAGLLLGREIAITRVRGTWHDYQGIPLMPTLHPAYVLRQYTPENRRAVWQDLQAAFERSRA